MANNASLYTDVNTSTNRNYEYSHDTNSSDPNPCALPVFTSTDQLDMYKVVPGILIFIFSFVMLSTDKLSWFPIGRTGGTLLGACLMLLCLVLPPPEATHAINTDVIALLFGSMLISEYLKEEGCLDIVAKAISGTPGVFLFKLTFVSAIVSSLITNDTCCVMFTPIVIAECKRRGFPLAPYLLALASSANIGAALTPIGSPQSMIIATNSGLNFVDICITIGPAVFLCLILNYGLILMLYYRKLQVFSQYEAVDEKCTTPKKKVSDQLTVVIAENLDTASGVEPHGDTTSGVETHGDTTGWLPRPLHRGLQAFGIIGCLIGFVAGLPLGWTAVGGAGWMLAIKAIHNAESAGGMIQKSNWSLLVFFASLFVVMRGVEETHVVSVMWHTLGVSPTSLHTLVGLTVFVVAVSVGSNVASNVPFVLMLVREIHAYDQEEQRLPWLLLLWVSSVAGNLTLVGSAANLIVAERAKECSGSSGSEPFVLGFWEYLKFGFPSSIVTLSVGAACTFYTTQLIPRISPVPPAPPLPPHILAKCGGATKNPFEHGLFEQHVLDPTPGDRPGLFFVGLSLSRNHPEIRSASPESVTRQSQFDFNRIIDRDYMHVSATNDDGWLVGGGESASSFKMPNPDSAHIEIVHIGTTNALRGGMSFEHIDAILSTFKFSPIRLKPSYATLNADTPPEFELRFTARDNPILASIQSRLKETFKNRLREAPDHFHMSIARKLGFRSQKDQDAFLDRANEEVNRWRNMYPTGTVLQPAVNAPGGSPEKGLVERPGGIYLFTNRNTIAKYYPPQL